MKAVSHITGLRAAVLSLSILAAAGCSTKTTSFDSGISASETALWVRNDSWQDVRIYLVSSVGVTSVRIGTVPAASSARIRVRGRLLQEIRNRGSVRLALRPIGSRASYVTEAVMVQLGDEIRLSVANQLSFSTVIVGRLR